MGSPTPTRWDRGVFTISLDFELAWGSRDLVGNRQPLVQMATVTRERVFPALLDLFVRHGIVATWATVGSLFCGGARREGGELHPGLVLPRHAWLPGGWLDAIPEGTEAEQPAWYARSLVERLRDAGQEVGSHSFTHPIFGDKGCDHEAADGDLSRCVAEARRLGIELRSFVFPRNVAGHQDLLARHGFRCWRALEPAWYRRAGVPVPVARLAHLAEAAAGARPPTVMPWRDEHGLVVIPASASILPVDGVRRLIPVRQRVRRVRRGIDAAAAEGRICHVYTHPINLASAPDALLGAMRAMVEHACRLRDAGRLEILPMAEIAERVLDV